MTENFSMLLCWPVAAMCRQGMCAKDLTSKRPGAMQSEAACLEGKGTQG